MILTYNNIPASSCRVWGGTGLSPGHSLADVRRSEGMKEAERAMLKGSPRDACEAHPDDVERSAFHGQYDAISHW